MTGIVVLGGDGASTRVVANALHRRFGLERIVLEGRENRLHFVKRRARRIGWAAVADQLAFQLAGKIAARGARRRLAAIYAAHGLDASEPPAALVTHVPSANDAQTIELLQRLQPKVVVVNGTRILSKRLLESVPSPFLNMHAGITPAYRGVHGGYWAMAQGERERCGVTVHLVDPGIDTGGVLYQAQIEPTAQDSFWTYPTLQVAAGLPLMMRAVEDALAGRLSPRPGEGPSALWSHPGLTGYLWRRFARGVA